MGARMWGRMDVGSSTAIRRGDMNATLRLAVRR
jgi:hypothetical protein